MGLLNRIAISGNKKAREQATTLRNNADAGKHEDFNARLLAEIEAKIAEMQKKQSTK